MTLCDKGGGKGGILNFVTSHFKNIKCNVIFYFLNILFIFLPMFDLMLILLKNNLNGNKNCCFNLLISRCKIAKYVMSH